MWGKDQFGKETRYVPFPSEGGRLPVMRTKELDQGGTAYWSNTSEAMQLAVPGYTQAIKNKEEDVVGFARNKIALFIGESEGAWDSLTFPSERLTIVCVWMAQGRGERAVTRCAY